MPCPHYSISVVSRGSGQSVMAAASYCLGQKLYSDHDGEWKYPHSSPQRVRYTEVMLPPNAPAEYADRQTLWNAVDEAEKRADAQTARRFVITLPKELTYEQNLALIRAYCQAQFVSKGMICDLYYHDEHDGNPHVHLLLTMRAMDEQGRWLPKTKTTYVLDENGERIRDIDALLAADKMIHDLQPVYDEYSAIRWKGAKERFATAHADELEQYKKAQRLLHKFSLTPPIDRKALQAEKAQLEQEVESLRPDVDAVQAELDELKTVRYWVRKVIPDALPHRTESGKPSLRNTMEESQNQNELNELLERSAKQVISPQQEEVQSVKTQQHQVTR